jgi:imidazolonepropionase-like amidohydrolase
VIAALALLAVQAVGELAVGESVLVISDVTVVPMDTQVLLEHHSVVVRAGRIASILPAGEAVALEGATLVDGRGCFLLPGLCDMHVHVWSADDLTLFVARGVTLVRNMFGSPMQLEMRRRIEAGDVLGPTLVSAGPIVDGEDPVWPGSAVVASAAAAERVVREQKEAGYDFVKVYAKLSPEAWRAILEEAGRQGVPVAGHVPGNVGLDEALASQQRSIEHMTGFESAVASALPVDGETHDLLDDLRAWPRFDEARARELAPRVARSGAWSCPTLVVWTGWVGPGEAARLEMRDEMRYVAPWTKAFWTQMRGDGDPRSASLAADIASGQAARLRMVGLLQEAGAPLLLGTDQGNPYIVAGFSVHRELELLVRAGLTPFQALASATREPARFLDRVGDFGTLTVGARADLVLLDGNPLADVRNTARIAGVVLRGAWHPREELDSLLDQIAIRNGAAPEQSE